MTTVNYNGNIVYENEDLGRVWGHMLWQHLDGDGAIQPGVGGLVDFAHAAGASAHGLENRNGIDRRT